MKPTTYLFPVLGLAASTLATACSESNVTPLDTSSTTADDVNLGTEINYLSDNIADDLIKVRSTGKRQSGLDCTSSESCFSADSLIFCLDPSTYDIRLEDGSSANLLTGNYTLSDGKTGNLYSDSISSQVSEATSTDDSSLAAQTTLPGTSAARTGSATVTAHTSTTASATATSNLANGVSATSSSTSTPSPSASENSGRKVALHYGGSVLAAIGAFFL